MSYFTCLAQKNCQLSLTAFNWFLILDKIQDGDHVWGGYRPPAAPPSIKYTSPCREDLKAVHWWENHSVGTTFLSEGGGKGSPFRFKIKCSIQSCITLGLLGQYQFQKKKEDHHYWGPNGRSLLSFISCLIRYFTVQKKDHVCRQNLLCDGFSKSFTLN